MIAQLRVAIVADHASARFGGEAALPLHYFRVMRARGMAVWLVSHSRTRDELSALYPHDPRIVYVEDAPLHRALHRCGQWLPARIAYFTTGFVMRLSTQLEQRRIVRALVRDHGVEVVHQPMPVSPREPSMMFGVGAPVVIGPMNGGMEFPAAFRRHRGAPERVFRWAGLASSTLLNRLMPGKHRAAALIVANQRTREALATASSTRVIELVENGVDLSLWRPSEGPRAHPRQAEATFVFLGRLVDWKAVDLLLRAFAQASRLAPMSLRIVGDGVERRALEQQARELGLAGGNQAGLAGRAIFEGWLPQTECAKRLDEADCLVLPSLLECGGAVVLEAMSLAKPVIATAWGGPLDYLDASCGVLVPPDSPDAIVSGLSEAMVALAKSPETRARMGRAGRAKVQAQYDWEGKVDRMLRIYADAVVAHHPDTVESAPRRDPHAR